MSVPAVLSPGADRPTPADPRAPGRSRALDLAVVVPLALVLAPLALLRALLGRARAGAWFERTDLIGRGRRPFVRLAFAGRWPGRDLALLINLLRGDLALAGPRPLRPAEAAALDLNPGADGGLRFTVRPGLVSPWAVKARTGIAHRPEALVDRDYVLGQSVRGDLGLVLRGLIAAVLGGSGNRPVPPVLRFFGVPVVNTTMAETLDWLVARAGGRAPTLVCFVNPDCLNIAWHDADYRRILGSADRVLPDGIGLHLGARLLGLGLRENVNGTDLFPLLCERAATAGLSLFLLGARPGVAAAAAAQMVERVPGLRIAGTADGYFSPDDEPALIARINASGAAVLLVAFGVPRQERWLDRHRDALAVPVRLGVGGLFDFYSGRIPRAPEWLREVGLEWTWRLAQEPGRLWRRYLIGNPVFLYRVWRQARRIEP